MAKRTRASARRGCATQTTRRPHKAAAKTAAKTAAKAAPKTAGPPAPNLARKSSVARTEQANLTRRRTFTPELLAYTRQRFEQTEDPFCEIAADLGVHRNTLRNIATSEGWTRYVPLPRGLPATVKILMQAEALERHPEVRGEVRGNGATTSAQAEGEGAIPPLADTIARLHRVILDELAGLETLRAQLKRAPRGSVGTARTLSTLTETLQKLQRLQLNPANTGLDDADMPANFDEFRNEIMHIARGQFQFNEGAMWAILAALDAAVWHGDKEFALAKSGKEATLQTFSAFERYIRSGVWQRRQANHFKPDRDDGAKAIRPSKYE